MTAIAKNVDEIFSHLCGYFLYKNTLNETKKTVKVHYMQQICKDRSMIE